MTYLRTSSRPADRLRRAAVGAVVIAGILAASVQFFFPHFFPSVAAAVATPFWRMELAIEGDTLRSPDAVLRQNEELKRMLAEAEVRMATVKAVEIENLELKALLNRYSESNADLNHATGTDEPQIQLYRLEADERMLAAVLERPPFSPYDQIIIDVGEADGVSVGDRIFAPGDVLVGRVVDVLPRTSKVMFYSSPGESLEVLIGSSSLPATSVGRGGGQYEAKLPQGMSVSPGDFVIAPSLNDRPFAEVSAVLSDPAQPFETVLFTPPVNLYQLRWVLVQRTAQ